MFLRQSVCNPILCTIMLFVESHKLIVAFPNFKDNIKKHFIYQNYYLTIIKAGTLIKLQVINSHSTIPGVDCTKPF